MKHTRNILVAPMNWGLGHATRCIPIINELISHGFNPILAGDGDSLALLRREFPSLLFHELPSYNIVYARNPSFFNIKMLQLLPGMIRAVRSEHTITKRLIKEYTLEGIISDNRFGVYNKRIPSVFITHQLNVMAGSASLLAGKLHRILIKNFDECWVPDYESGHTLSGKLGHVKNPGFRVVYLGPLSRFTKTDLPTRYNLMVLLSGPEPQRTVFEDLAKKEVQKFKGKVLFVRGLIEESPSCTTTGHITICNYLSTAKLQQALNESALVVSRSGYTTVMDLAFLQKKAFFVPTPGQYEQEYLAARMNRLGIAPMSPQKGFNIENIVRVSNYKGLQVEAKNVNWKRLFSLFERE